MYKFSLTKFVPGCSLKKLTPYIVFLFVIFFFGAFSTYYFNDDFYFLKISRNFNLTTFISPFRTTFYRPLPTEFFYFFLQKLPYPMITGHLIVFAVFLIGVYFLYKTIQEITKNNSLSIFSSILYLFHFSHVYQLYWLATFQEVAQFALLTSSLYYLLRKKFTLSVVMFTLALFSKEQALLFPLIAISFYYLRYKKPHPILFAYLILDFFFIGLHLFVNSRAPVLSEYAIHLNPKLFINNSLWYSLWSLGFPAMMPDYMRSIFSLPFGAFWDYFKQPMFIMYFFGMILYLGMMMVSIIGILLVKNKDRTNLVRFIIGGSVLSLYFLFPVLPIIHKWMVRLTIPLIFISVVEGCVYAILWSQKKKRALVVFLLVLYLVWNYFGIKQHEVISTYALESSITQNAALVFSDVRRFENCQSLYIQNPKQMKMSSWEGSEKIALTLSGESFVSYYFPKRNDLRVFYAYKTPIIPKGSCIVDSNELIKK